MMRKLGDSEVVIYGSTKTNAQFDLLLASFCKGKKLEDEDVLQPRNCSYSSARSPQIYLMFVKIL